MRCVKRINIMLAILTVAMGMALALGSIAANRGKARKLIRRSNNGLGAAKSLFSEGLHYLEEETQRLGKLPKLPLPRRPEVGMKTCPVLRCQRGEGFAEPCVSPKRNPNHECVCVSFLPR